MAKPNVSAFRSLHSTNVLADYKVFPPSHDNHHDEAQKLAAAWRDTKEFSLVRVTASRWARKEGGGWFYAYSVSAYVRRTSNRWSKKAVQS